MAALRESDAALRRADQHLSRLDAIHTALRASLGIPEAVPADGKQASISEDAPAPPVSAAAEQSKAAAKEHGPSTAQQGGIAAQDTDASCTS